MTNMAATSAVSTATVNPMKRDLDAASRRRPPVSAFGAALAAGIAISIAFVLPLISSAQRRDREAATARARAVPADAAVQWTAFVSSYGTTAARRMTISAEAGAIPLPMPSWQCTYSTPTRANLDAVNWSEVRTLECTHGDAVVSTTGFCQIAGASWGARAGVLALGAGASTARVTVTLDCSVID
jgi:hypothetical protein